MSREGSIRSRFAVSRLSPAAAALFGVVAFVQSYQRWLDPIIDVGRDLYIPEQLRLGATLYHDILYYYPPLTPYALAAITFFTGSSLGAYVAIGLATAVLTASAIWSIVRPLAGEVAASAGMAIFFSFSMAGFAGWRCNYFFPYAHAATFAMLFFLWSVALFLRGRPAAATLLLVAASWTKVEYAAFAVVVLVAAAIARRARWWLLVLYAAAMLLVLLIAIAFFGADVLRANVLPSALFAGAPARLFYARVTGAIAWQQNLLRAAQGAALVAVLAVLLAAWDRRPRLRVWIAIAALIAAAGVANDAFFRAWSILQLALVPFALRRPREPLALLLAVSLCASSRIYLNLVPTWYGFVFIVPVVVLIVYVLFAWLPARGLYASRTALAWLPLLALLCIRGLLAARASYSDAFPVETRRGAYLDYSRQRADAMSGLLRHLAAVRANELVVMPEGLAINYLAGVRTPLRYQTFTPVEIAGEEPAVVAELEETQPRFVLLVQRDVREFGYRGFGIDYGRAIVAWLGAHYAVEGRYGAMLLLRRVRGEADPPPRQP